MHGLDRIIGSNAFAAGKQLDSKTKRPATFDRAANNGRPRFPATSELTDRRPAPHGDPLTAAHDRAKDRPSPDTTDELTTVKQQLAHVLRVLEDLWTWTERDGADPELLDADDRAGETLHKFKY